jgi:hypothetical protein
MQRRGLAQPGCSDNCMVRLGRSGARNGRTLCRVKRRLRSPHTPRSRDRQEDSVRHVDPIERVSCIRTVPALLECAGLLLQGQGLRGVRSAPRTSSECIQSWLPPRLRCFPGKSTSGCTTRMCRVNASLREKVFSSTQRAQRTFCLRAL